MVKPQTSDIRMAYEYMRVTYVWYTDDIRVHTSDIRVAYIWHMSEIRMTYEYIQVTYEWHTDNIQVIYGWYTSDIRVHKNDTRMTCKTILNCIAFEAFISSFSVWFVVRTLLYVVANNFGYYVVSIFFLFCGIFLS